MTKVCFVSDTHGQHNNLIIPECEVLVHCGDFSNLGTEEELVRFADWLKKQKAPHIFISPGNHDGEIAEENPKLAKQIIEFRPGVRLLFHEGFEFGGLKWFISCYTPEFAGWYFMLEQDEIAQKWAEIPDDTQVLITHGPPYGVLDTVERQVGHHAGCRKLLERVGQLKQLRQHCFGHLHFSGGQTEVINGVCFHNAAVLDDRNHFRNQPQVFDL